MSVSDNDIVFLTTALNTKWLALCKKQVKKYFPNSEHVIINGKGQSKFWYKWLNVLQQKSQKYCIHLDEDCFLLQRAGILDIIRKLESDNYHLAGVPDAYYPPRGFNSVAMNPFFMIGKTKFIKNVISNRNWENTRFQAKWKTIKIDWVKKAKPSFRLYEPYYSFYWAMLNNSAKFLYLYPKVNQQLTPATDVFLTENSTKICTHMWYLRESHRPSHVNRYKKLENVLNE